MHLRVFITGASSGIGEALAVHYAAQGAHMGLVARRAEKLAQLNQTLGGQHCCYPLDVTDATALQHAAQDFIQTAGVPDIVIAAAGVSTGTLGQHPEDLQTLQRVVDVNLQGLAASFSPFIAPMNTAGGKRCLVGIASIAGIRGMPGAGAYSASKAAVIAYLESLRLEMRGSPVRVITITPGFTDTPMTRINPFPMPFLLPAPVAARRIARAIEAEKSYCVIPWQMGIMATLLKCLPNWLYDPLFARAPTKPRVPVD